MITRYDPDEASFEVISDCLPDYLEECRNKGLTDSTVRAYKQQLNTWFEQCGHLAPDEITSNVIRDYIAQRREEGRKQSTVRAYAKIISAFLTFLDNENIIDEKPNITLPKKSQKKPRHLHDEQVEALLEVCGPVDECAVLLMYEGGLRISEVADLRWDDLQWDEESGLLEIEVRKGKGHKPRTCYAGRRTHEKLEQLWNWYKHKERDEVFFISASTIRQHLYERGNELDFHASPHMLRHSFARKYILNGGDISTLKELLGHSDIQTTMIYLDFEVEDIKSSYAKIMKP